MNIERHDLITRPVKDLEYGEVFEYNGTPHIRTNIITSNFGCRKVECCNLDDGIIEEIPEEKVVCILQAKVVIG